MQTQEKKKRNKLRVALSTAILILIIVYVSTNTSFTANFADSVLRPLIGNNNTIYIEKLFFNTKDSIYKVAYNYLPASQGPDNFASSSNLKWQPVNSSVFPEDTVMESTTVKTDPERPYSMVRLVKIDMQKLSLAVVAGTKEPGGAIGNSGPGIIPDSVKSSNNLVAAFNGGFQMRDGHYGMIVQNKIFLPLKEGLATLVIDNNFKPQIIEYNGQNLGNYFAVRQNGEMLIRDSKIIPSSSDKLAVIWGRSVTANMYTWRSGIGITKDGNLIYAVGPSLIPETLAKGLLLAGAVNAMQLDINPYWVRFVVFTPLGNGTYTHTSLFKNMYDGGNNFLSGYQKDFFYLYKS